MAKVVPSIIGSIPDRDVSPVLGYLAQARQAGLTLSYGELLTCLLLVRLGT